MSEFTTTTVDQTDAQAGAPAGLVIAACQDEIDRLQGADVGGLLDGAQLYPVDAGDPLPHDVLAAARLLVLETDPAIPGSLQRIRAIRSERRALPIIAALRGMDVTAIRTLVREGIADVIELPFLPHDLAALVSEVTARLAPAPDRSGVAPLFAIVGGVGGSGTTTVMTHLAEHLARARDLRICVVDLDVQSGEVAYYCGQTPRVTIEALIGAGDRLDAEIIGSATLDSGHGFWLIAAPDKVMPLDEVKVDEVLTMLAILRRQFDLVLVDLPTDWTSWSLSVVDACTRVVLVSDLSVACLRQAKRRFDLFDNVGIDTDRVRLVANRVEHKLFKTFSLDDASEALGREFIAALPNAGQEMTDAQDEGLLLFDVHRHTKFEDAVEQLGKALLDQSE